MRNREIAKKIRNYIIDDYKSRYRKGIFAETSKMMAYNSNKIEGSTLTSEETASLFDTGEILATGDVVYRSKDIEEMNGHFYMFNHALDTIDRQLDVNLIKAFHKCLKQGVFEDIANGYVPGEFRKSANIVSDIQTALPSDVPARVSDLVARYNAIKDPEVEDIMRFHAEYEHIHPFQDGNGRTGRMIVFRECLRNDIIPVIIRDETKQRYYHALHRAQIEGDISELTDYTVEQQELYYEVVKKYL